MAEEDLIYGKNRHFFGGIEPSNMKRFSVHKVNNKPRISVELPDDTVIDGQTLCTVAGAVIRRKVRSYPENEFDGELVKDMKHDDIFIDNVPSDGSDYYYAAFPYTTQGVYNRNKKNITKYGYNSQYGYLYGFDIDLNDPNQDTRVSYPEDVENHDFRSAKMNFNTGIFDYGDWPSMPGEGFMPRPCVVRGDGSVARYLDIINDGNRLNRSIPEENENDMIEWGKIYTKRWIENSVYHFRCSDAKLDPDYNCWCNYNVKEEEIPNFYTSMYPITDVSTDVASFRTARSLCNPYITSSYPKKYTLESMADMSADVRNYINRHGVYMSSPNESYVRRSQGNLGWCGGLLCDYMLIYDLLVLMAKSNNLAQSYGLSGCITPPIDPSYNEMFKGYNNRVDSPGVVFGMYNFWGSNEGLYGISKTYPTSSNGGSYYSMSYKIVPSNGTGNAPGFWRDNPGYSDDLEQIDDGYGWMESNGISPMSGYVVNSIYTDSGLVPVSTRSGSKTTYDGRYVECYFKGGAIGTHGTGEGSSGDNPMSLISRTWSADVYHRLSLKPVYIPPVKG